MSKLSMFLVFFIFVGFVNSHSLGRFLIEEPFKRGEFGTAYVTMRNNFDRDLEDVNVNFYIYDLGLRFTSLSGDIDEGGHVVQRLFMYVPENIPRGDYLTKISAGNDYFRDTQHLYLRIV